MKTRGFIVLLILFFVYRLWFSFSHTLSSGDWPYLYLENIKEFSWSLDPQFLWLAPYYQILSKVLVQYAGIPWEVAERLLWFWPFLLISIVSSYYLFRSWIGVLVFTTNTYILMVVSGGQMGVALAYSVAPFVLGTFIKLIDRFRSTGKIFNFQFSIFNSFIAGLVLAIQTMLDPRAAYVTFIAILPYWIFKFFYKTYSLSSFFKSVINVFGIPIFITFIVNSFWILPFILGRTSFQIEGFKSLSGFKFLSFADFSHAFSLLHPNWPENIFGKIYFMKAEFIILPILAYLSLLFLKNSNLKTQISKPQLKTQKFNNLTIEQSNNRTILFFSFLGLTGAFLAKGVNPPFGEINSFLFQYFPGMSMFRDATKFYLLIVLSYSALIPFSIYNIFNWLSSKFKIQNSKLKFKVKSYTHNLFLIFTILYLLFLIRPAIFGELGGTFKTHKIPQEYITLKEFFKKDSSFAPILWIPEKQRFGFASKNHPALLARELFKEENPLLISKRLSTEKSMITFLRKRKVRYIIIPFDSEGELLLEDRKYSKIMREKIEKDLDTLQDLVKKKDFEKITVYEIH